MFSCSHSCLLYFIPIVSGNKRSLKETSVLILLLKFTARSKCKYIKFISGWGLCPQTPASWVYNHRKPLFSGYAPGLSYCKFAKDFLVKTLKRLIHQSFTPSEFFTIWYLLQKLAGTTQQSTCFVGMTTQGRVHPIFTNVRIVTITLTLEYPTSVCVCMCTCVHPHICNQKINICNFCGFNFYYLDFCGLQLFCYLVLSQSQL